MRPTPLLAVLLALSACVGGFAPSRGDLHQARVTRHIDGDTLEVSVGGRTERVRFIGIDTPERGEPFYREASAFTARRAPFGARVWLEFDVQQRDRFGRLLAYVWLEHPEGSGPAPDAMLNAALVEQGLATILTIPPNIRYAEVFQELQQRARAAGTGSTTIVGRRGLEPRPAG